MSSPTSIQQVYEPTVPPTSTVQKSPPKSSSAKPILGVYGRLAFLLGTFIFLVLRMTLPEQKNTIQTTLLELFPFPPADIENYSYPLFIISMIASYIFIGLIFPLYIFKLSLSSLHEDHPNFRLRSWRSLSILLTFPVLVFIIASITSPSPLYPTPKSWVESRYGATLESAPSILNDPFSNKLTLANGKIVYLQSVSLAGNPSLSYDKDGKQEIPPYPTVVGQESFKSVSLPNPK